MFRPGSSQTTQLSNKVMGIKQELREKERLVLECRKEQKQVQVSKVAHLAFPFFPSAKDTFPPALRESSYVLCIIGQLPFAFLTARSCFLTILSSTLSHASFSFPSVTSVPKLQATLPITNRIKEMSDRLLMILTILSFLRIKKPQEIIQNCIAKANRYSLGNRCLTNKVQV